MTTDTETRIMPYTHGPDHNSTTFDAVYRAFYTVERFSYGHWVVNTSHRDVEIAKAEARRQVTLRGEKRKNVRIKRRWRAVATA